MKFEGLPTPAPEELNKTEEPEPAASLAEKPDEPESSRRAASGNADAQARAVPPERPAEQPPAREEPGSEATGNAEGEVLKLPLAKPEAVADTAAEEAPREAPASESAPQEHEPTPEEKAWSEHVDAVAEEETRKLLPEKLAQARRGLGQLYDLLPHDRNPSEEEISALIDHTELDELLPWWRKKLAGKIRWENLARKSKAEFIAGGMELLYAWAYTEAMKDASGAVLELLRQDRGMRPARGSESAEAA